MRAIVLYPTNALVEDQVSRLRRALRRIAAAGGPQLWFGRYTGATLGGSRRRPEVAGNARAEEAARELRAMVAEHRRAARRRRGADRAASSLTHVSGEMLTRWDMVDAPPDILVTNYSMLNVMLMRDLRGADASSRRGDGCGTARATCSRSWWTSSTSTAGPRAARWR